MNIQFWVNFSAIVGVPIAIIGVIITWRYQIRQSNKKIDSLHEVINLQNKYQSQGAQYHNCSFYAKPVDANQISQEYQNDIKKTKENE